MKYTQDELSAIYKASNNGSDKLSTEAIFNAMNAIAADAEAKLASAAPVATLLGPDPYDERTGFYLSLEDRERLSKLPAETRLFTEAQPAPDAQAAAVAAALEKAEEACGEASSLWSNLPPQQAKAFANFCKKLIRAIPRDTSALDAYVREKCLAVAKLRSDTDAMGYTDAAYQVSDEDLVDRVLAK